MSKANNPFGMNELIDNLRLFCKAQSIDAPKSWIIKPHDYFMSYAVSLHLNGKDRWEEFDTQVIYVLRDLSRTDNREVEERLLKHIFEEIGEPIVLTIKATESSNQKYFFSNVGMIQMPVCWSDDFQNEYKVYTKGRFKMGGFVNLMEHVEYIGKEIVYKYYKEI